MCETFVNSYVLARETTRASGRLLSIMLMSCENLENSKHHAVMAQRTYLVVMDPISTVVIRDNGALTISGCSEVASYSPYDGGQEPAVQGYARLGGYRDEDKPFLLAKQALQMRSLSHHISTANQNTPRTCKAAYIPR